MTVPNFLAFISNDGQVQDARLVLYKDGTVSNIGNPLPSPAGGGNAVDPKDSSYDDRARIAFFKRDIYVVVGSTVANRGGVFRTQDLGQSWVQVLDFDGAAATSALSLHLHTIVIKGEETLCLVAWNSDARVFKSNDGTNWDLLSWDPGTTAARLGNDLVVGSKLWLLPQDATSANFGGRQFFTFEFDSEDEVCFPSYIDGLNDSDCCSAWCYFNGNVYLARPDTRGSSTTVNVYRLVDAAGPTGDGANLHQIVATITHTAGDVERNSIKWDMFTDGTNMYLFHFHSNTEGWLCHQIDSSFVVTDLTSTVLPNYMSDTAMTSVTDNTDSGMVRVLTDQTSNPTNPNYYIYVNRNTQVDFSGNFGIPNNNVPWRIYQWQGNATEMSYIDEGGGVLHAINFGRTKTSDQGPWYATRFFDISAPIVSIVNQALLPNENIRVYYRVDAVNSVTAGVFRFPTARIQGLISNTETGDLATSQATLVNAGPGSLAANVVSGVPVATGGIFFVDWDRATDGITDSTSYSFRLVVSNDA